MSMSMSLKQTSQITQWLIDNEESYRNLRVAKSAAACSEALGFAVERRVLQQIAHASGLTLRAAKSAMTPAQRFALIEARLDRLEAAK